MRMWLSWYNIIIMWVLKLTACDKLTLSNIYKTSDDYLLLLTDRVE